MERTDSNRRKIAYPDELRHRLGGSGTRPLCLGLLQIPGHPEPQNPNLSVGTIEVAVRRTREPLNVEKGTAPPHVYPISRGQLRGGPLKHVPHHVVSAIRAHSAWIQAHRRRMPDLTQVIIGVRRIDFRAPPWVLRTLRATSRSFPFLLGGQPATRPLAVRRRLMPRHVHHGPVLVPSSAVRGPGRARHPQKQHTGPPLPDTTQSGTGPGSPDGASHSQAPLYRNYRPSDPYFAPRSSSSCSRESSPTRV